MVVGRVKGRNYILVALAIIRHQADEQKPAICRLQLEEQTDAYNLFLSEEQSLL